MTSKFAFLLAPILAFGLQLIPSVLAEEPQDKPGRELRAERGARLANLTDDERAKFKAARRKAMADPAVRAAHDQGKQNRKEFRKLKRAAMLKADPSIQPILDKIRAGRSGKNKDQALN